MSVDGIRRDPGSWFVDPCQGFGVPGGFNKFSRLGVSRILWFDRGGTHGMHSTGDIERQ